MRPKALVVEDSRFYLQLIKKGLEDRLGFEVLNSSTLAGARDILAAQASEILVALLDLHLPDAPNGEVVDELAQYKIPSIIFTGSFSDEIREFVLSRNAVDYITKDGPENLDTVFDLVRRISLNTSNRILVVDDSRVSRRHISDLLQLHRFTVVEAANAEEALERLNETPDFCLAIIDYNMPGINGVELTRKIRAKFGRHQLVVVGLSAYGNNVVSARFMKAGANDYLNKPFVPEELFCRIYHNLELVEQISTLRKARDELNGALAAMRRSSEEKTRFLAHFNHELGTPLNAIIGFSELALTGPEAIPPAFKRNFDAIFQCGMHLKDLVSDALDLARVESGHLELYESDVDLGQLCLDVVEMLSPQAEGAGISLTGDFHPGGPKVKADARRLKQVMLNLAGNALKFTPAQGRVGLAAGISQSGQPFFMVEDTGCGMDANGIAIALTPFGQLGDAASRSKGTGLGLPLSKSLIEAHGGQLHIDSVPGQGTKMWVFLGVERLQAG